MDELTFCWDGKIMLGEDDEIDVTGEGIEAGHGEGAMQIYAHEVVCQVGLVELNKLVEKRLILLHSVG